jgi:hypothetical protein
MLKVLEAFAVVVAFLLGAGAIAAFYLTGEEALRDPTRLGMYGLFTIGALTLAGGHAYLVEKRRRSAPPGLAPLLLVSVTYMLLCIGAAMLGITLITALILFLGVEPGAEHVPYHLDQAAWALIGGATLGFLQAAAVFVYGYRYDLLDLPVAPWPWVYFQRRHRERRRMLAEARRRRP